MVNHGLDLALLSEVQAAMGAFFALPPAAKRAVARSASNPLGFFDSERTKQVRMAGAGRMASGLCWGNWDALCPSHPATCGRSRPPHPRRRRRPSLRR